MNNKKVVKAEKTKRRTVVHTIDKGDGKTERKEFAAIRAGLSWPIPGGTPSYFVVVGEEYVPASKYEGQESQRGRLIFLGEHEAGSFLMDILPSLTDHCTLFGCNDIYCDFDERKENHIDEVHFCRTFVYDQKVGHINFLEAPHHNDFSLGISLIRHFINQGLLTVPEGSLAHEQLKALTEQDLGDSPETHFHALNGLRFVIGAFYKFAPHYGPVFTPKRPYKPRTGRGLR